MSKFAILIICVLITSTMLAGCGKNDRTAAAAAMAETSVKEAIVVAEPQEAVNEIYDSLKRHESTPIADWKIKDQLGVDPSHIVECYGRVSDANEGLADVAVILPKESHREDIHLALSKYKERRMEEFENYDILDAYSISQNAVIYDQGEYVIMLMLADNDSARAIIDEYIPL